MIICSSCNSENPGNHRFCQQCGHPLQVWRAFLVPCSLDLSKRVDEAAPALAATLYQQGPDQAFYLKGRQRYQIQVPFPKPSANQSIELMVIDCHPEDESPLVNLQAAWLQAPSQEVAQLKPDPSLPSAALPYLALQADFFPIVPELHDAWLTPDYAILLIEDRSQWTRLQDCWQVETDFLQRISWLYEITLLWDALAPWHCQHALLSLDRLRIDEDQILCIEHLAGSPSQPPQLADLGLAWQPLGLIADPAGPLHRLIDDLAAGQITDTETLKQQLAQIADQSQAAVATLDQSDETGSLPTTTPPPDFSDLALATPEPGTAPAADPSDFELGTASDAEEGLQTTDPFSLEDWQDSGDDADAIDSPTMVLPMKLVQVGEIGRTNVGRQREHNEDFYCAQTHIQKRNTPQESVLLAKGLYVLCDGMGGHASGEVASELAVQTLIDFFAEHWQAELPSQETLHQAVASANQAIYEINQANSSLGSGRMGTTLVMVLLQNTQAVVVHVGDSRLYTYNRRFGLSQVTVDHEVGQREIQRGVEPAIAYARPDAYQLTQALGPRSQKDLKPDITYIDIVEDTLFLLCSDGLSDNELIERNYTTHVEPLLKSQADLEQGVAKLISLANEKNGHDNITAILIRVKLAPNMDKLPD